MKTRSWFILAGFAALIGGGYYFTIAARETRPPMPPENLGMIYPWGAMHVDSDQDEADSDLEKSMMASFRAEPTDGFDPDDDGVREYFMLALSGGGSAGAFGAGFLNGWSKAGTRPDFKVVTGVSTGSLQSTFAFLGPEYDDELTEVFQDYDTEHIYTGRGPLRALLGASAWESAPLKHLIDQYIDEEVLAAVAAKHAKGHRLFVGTTNMDTDEFVIWDMGAIASSSKPDKLDRYRNVLLASCSIPVLFPPVYFEIEADGEEYYEMHMDGGAQSQLFLRGFMLDLEDALIDAGIEDRQHELYLYVIRNGMSGDEPTRDNVDASSLSIATEMINGVFDLSTSASLYRVYVLANRYGVDFNLASIPDDFEPRLDPVIFDLEKMKALYDFAFEQASGGYEWTKVPPGLDRDEVYGNQGK
ncbi:MAG: patatin-like phospholipase family protein [Planctomycetota bacterium]